MKEMKEIQNIPGYDNQEWQMRQEYLTIVPAEICECDGVFDRLDSEKVISLEMTFWHMP